jgi:hypothetical protein
MFLIWSCASSYKITIIYSFQCSQAISYITAGPKFSKPPDWLWWWRHTRLLQWDLNQLYCSCEPSALEGLVRGFISTPLSFVKRLSSVDWPSWRSERHGRSFPRFSLRKNFCLDHSCFGSCFDLFVLGSTLRLDFCPGKERGAPSSAVCFQEKPTQTSGHFWKVKV